MVRVLLFVGGSTSAVTVLPDLGSLRRSNLPLGKVPPRGCIGSHFLPVIAPTMLFCAFVRLQAYPKCSILECLLLFTVVLQRRITPPQYLLLRCCPGFYCDWGREYTQVARLQGTIATPWL